MGTLPPGAWLTPFLRLGVGVISWHVAPPRLPDKVSIIFCPGLFIFLLTPTKEPCPSICCLSLASVLQLREGEERRRVEYPEMKKTGEKPLGAEPRGEESIAQWDGPASRLEKESLPLLPSLIPRPLKNDIVPLLYPYPDVAFPCLHPQGQSRRAYAKVPPPSWGVAHLQAPASL